MRKLWGFVWLLVVFPTMLVWQGVADWIDRRLARCQPHQRYGTHVWHYHSFLGHRWFTTHGNAGIRK